LYNPGQNFELNWYALYPRKHELTSVIKPKTMVSPPFANNRRLMKTPTPGHLSDLFAGGDSFGAPASKLSSRRCVFSEPHLLHTIEHIPVN
jgi:hypothetical protein